MPTAKGTVEGRPVTVLRDTGCSSVVVRRSLIPDSKLTGQEALCSLIDGTIRRPPVAKIFVQTPYNTGLTTAVCMLNPIYDLIVGNVRGATEPNSSVVTSPSRSHECYYSGGTGLRRQPKEPDDCCYHTGKRGP